MTRVTVIRKVELNNPHIMKGTKEAAGRHRVKREEWEQTDCQCLFLPSSQIQATDDLAILLWVQVCHSAKPWQESSASQVKHFTRCNHYLMHLSSDPQNSILRSFALTPC